jgi:hypothetical protein
MKQFFQVSRRRGGVFSNCSFSWAGLATNFLRALASPALFDQSILDCGSFRNTNFLAAMPQNQTGVLDHEQNHQQENSGSKVCAFGTQRFLHE